MELILASKSARRQEILRNLNIRYTVFTEDVDESLDVPVAPDEAVRCLAERKLRAAAAALGGNTGIGEDRILLSADTVVALDGEIYGKPKDEADAIRMLRSMSGRTHSVYTGYAVMRGDRIEVGAEETQVTFRPITDEDIRFYIRTEPPYDKAGAYGIQELAGLFVAGIRGDYFNIVGLPVSAIAHRCREALGVSFFDLVARD